jgi:large subunit ribosomal protein L3
MRYAFKKIGMTSIFDEAGIAKGVTVLRLLPSKIVRNESTELGQRVAVVEYDLGNKSPLTKGWVVAQDAALGEALPALDLKVGSNLKITGRSKGKGFQDAVTRHGFAGGPASHGSRFHRAPGSVGMRTEPGRTPKGKKLPGHMGDVAITVSNLKVAYWSASENLLAVFGGVPGSRGTVVFI